MDKIAQVQQNLTKCSPTGELNRVPGIEDDYINYDGALIVNPFFSLSNWCLINWSSSTRSPAAVVAPARNSHNRKHMMNHKSFD
jgi:hypothetical protein